MCQVSSWGLGGWRGRSQICPDPCWVCNLHSCSSISSPCTIKGPRSKGTCTYKCHQRIVGLCQQVEVQATSRIADAGKHFLTLWWECKNLSKNAFMDCFVCKCLLSDTPQGFTGQFENVQSEAWEFPSTKAVLPLFVIPQRTCWSITRDPYLTLSLALGSYNSIAEKFHCQLCKKQKDFWISVVCVHPQMCRYLCMCVHVHVCERERGK